MRYAVIIEKAKRNYSAYAPDIPGCVATGKTVAEVLANMKDAIEFHFEDDSPEDIPSPETLCDYVEVDIAASRRRSERKIA